jgi:glycosyltransferase involved in cell wall biosynthesis
MRILMLAPGTSIHSTRFLRWLLDGGHDVLFLDRDAPDPGTDVPFQFRPYPGGIKQRGYQWLLGWRRSFELEHWSIARRLRRIYRSFRPDVVHLHWVNRRAYDCVRARMKPLVLTVWGTDINHLFEPSVNVVYRQLIGQTLAAVDAIFVDAADMADKCRRLAGRGLATEVLPYGIDTEQFRPGYAEEAGDWRRRLGVARGAFVLASMRAFTPGKYGHREILEAFALARGRFAREAVLVFKTYDPSCGADDTRGLRQELQQAAERAHLVDQIRWVEQVPYARLPVLYAFADGVVNFPPMDAFPVTFLEAAACGRPVVSCLLPSYRNTFAEGYFRMTPPGDVRALADALVCLVNEPAAARASALAAARAAVVKDYDEAGVRRRLVAAYQRLAARDAALGLPR